MKHYICYFLLLHLVLFSACQPNEDITTIEYDPLESVEVTEMTIEGSVIEPFSYFSTVANLRRIHNATVQLIYEGEVLDEAYTDERGRYAFPPQLVPVEGAYLLATAPGYYPGSYKVDSFAIDFLGHGYFGFYILRETNENFAGERITSDEEKVVITGSLQSPSEADACVFYLTTNDNELAGVYASDLRPDFAITTLANTELKLYYRYRDCEVFEPISLGPFSENTHVGVLLDEDEPLVMPSVTIEGVANTCDGDPADGYVLINRNHRTIYNIGGLNDGQFWGFTEGCQFDTSPKITVTAITTDPRRYGEVTMNYTPGLALNPAIDICTEDDTYFHFSIDSGEEYTVSEFTVANILPDGRAIVKKMASDRFFNIIFSLEIAGTDADTDYLGNLVCYQGVSTLFSVEDVVVHIDSNDGEFLEGTINGIAVSSFEETLGDITASFRARIQ